MFVLVLECRQDEKDILIAALWERGTSGIVERELPEKRVELHAFFEKPIDEIESFRIDGARIEAAEDRDWMREMQGAFPALLVGRRFFLVPDWIDEAAPEGRLRLVVHPGMACGTGVHETTQLSLEAMENHLTPGDRVLDVGTGSGILISAAKLLGASLAVGCDIDHEAVAIARQNLKDAAVFTGSVRSIASNSFDVVVSNINAETVVMLAGEIRRVLRAGGRAILTGFPTRHLERVRAAAIGHEIAFIEKGGWACLVIERL